YLANGSVEKYKARVVAKGYNQKEGVNYKETFSPVAEMMIVRTLLAVVISKGWFIEQLDINNAFLHGDLHEEVYMTVPQGKCTLDLLRLANVLDSKPYATPIDPNVKLNHTDGFPLHDPSLYRTLVGKLIYLTIIRSDITFAAQTLSQFLKEPRSSYMKALLRVLRYLKLCLGQGLFFSATNNLNLLTYCDSDWASCSFPRRSVLGYGIFLGTSLISWQSKNQ
nr:integrase, catalytic core [Tanacetum cinerariifolium]